ncbi:hypothetical protein ElyMa_000987000 [Elysia marginata]|uniref:Uncharacterized protein n=1 Tax=Elysia marginata TaxID=1093978 RepID=A0AAV4HH58_9GAST|nr:hypothetical protein ElyMa_000987000 [Elysia marginata]
MTLMGTRLYQAVKSSDGFGVMYRHLSCFCLSCESGKPDQSERGKCVNQWSYSKVAPDMILDVHGDEAKVQFCRQSNCYFFWPPVEDISWVPLTMAHHVDAPTLDAREKIYLPQELMS